MINQPPRIFGNFAADGSPIAATLSGDPIFLGGSGPMMTDEAREEAKRRRIARVINIGDLWIVRVIDVPHRPATCAERRR
jgi:hypothetical protein